MGEKAVCTGPVTDTLIIDSVGLYEDCKTVDRQKNTQCKRFPNNPSFLLFHKLEMIVAMSLLSRGTGLSAGEQWSIN